jgi:hypothetical protein
MERSLRLMEEFLYAEEDVGSGGAGREVGKEVAVDAVDSEGVVELVYMWALQMNTGSATFLQQRTRNRHLLQVLLRRLWSFLRCTSR